ncbi:MAG: DUF1127 domain-containing protein [Pseudomonadota bacterium]
MAYYTQTKTVSIVERLLAGAAFALESAATKYAYYRIYRASLSELRALSDHELNDIGIHRSSLKAVARDAAQRQMGMK